MDFPLPGVNALVSLWRPGDGEPYHSRVEDLDGDCLLVAAPELANGVPELAEELSLHWGTVRGAMSLPVRVLSAETVRVPVWRLQPTGAVQVSQRRGFVRSGAVGGVKITPLALRGALPCHGSLVDVSETGVRFRAPVRSLRQDDEVQLELDLDGESIVVTGNILRVSPDLSDSDEVVAVFAAAEETAHRLRRYVIARQLHERRIGRR